ncbi:MAG: hypothetical protein WCH98_07090 [Verrucomicrobiota bacterium]
MSTTEILNDLPKLTLKDREEIRHKLAKIDGDGWIDDQLSASDKALLQTRIAEHEQHPETAIPWEVFGTKLKQRLGA